MRRIQSFIRTFWVAGLLLAGFACEDDLNVEPGDDQLLLADEFFQNPDAFRSALAGVYSNLALTGTDGTGSSFIAGLDAGTSQYGRGLMNLQTFTTDEAIWSYENDPGLRELNRAIWTSGNPILTGIFGRAMLSVAFANDFLRQTEDGVLNSRGITGSVRDEIPVFRAEARFLRALAYYHLMDLFGKAPFVTDADPIGAFQPPQASRAELFTYVESELLAILDELEAPRSNEWGRADRGAAWMLLAKVYLNAEVFVGEDRYSDAMTYIENLLGAGYTLADNYDNIFNADNDVNEGSNEIIFPVISDGQTVQNFGPTTVMTNGAVGSIEDNGLSIGVSEGGWGGAIRITREWSELFLGSTDFAGDSRNNILFAGRDADISDISDRDQGYVMTKFSNLTSTGAQGSDITLCDADFPMFRLGDVHLMYAECFLRGGGGNQSTALNLVNALRERANGDSSQNITAGDLTLDFILDERSRELHWESHRRQDLIRFGQFTGGTYNWAWKGNVPSGQAIPDHFDVFPIPTASLATNPNLTQNTGY